MSLPFDQLRAFLAVVRGGSFVHAADALHLTPSAVSQQIQRLEESCDLKLFDRLGRGVRLNSAGEILQPYAERIDSLINDAHHALDAARGLRKGSLRIISSATAAAYYLPPVGAEFKNRYPGIRLRVSIGNSERVIEQIVRFQTDVGVLSLGEPNNDLVLEPLVDDPLVAIVAPSHPWGRWSTLPLDAFHGKEIILREPGSASRQLIEQTLTAAGIRYDVSIELGSHELIKRTVEIGGTIAIVPSSIVASEVATGKLSQIVIQDSAFHRQLYLGYHRERQGAPLIVALIDLAQYFQRRGFRP